MDLHLPALLNDYLSDWTTVPISPVGTADMSQVLAALSAALNLSPISKQVPPCRCLSASGLTNSLF